MRFCFVVTFTVYKLKQLVQINLNGYKLSVGDVNGARMQTRFFSP